MAKRKTTKKSSMGSIVLVVIVLAIFGSLISSCDGNDSTPNSSSTATPRKTSISTTTSTPRPTATPTAEPTEVPHLRKGDTGENVTAMQQRLIQLGYLSDGATGEFDAKTVQAIKDFQVVNGLAETGEADPNTLPLLYSFYSAKRQRTVYVSNSGTYHGKSNCSGMKNYKEMSLSEAIRKQYKRHDQCN